MSVLARWFPHRLARRMPAGWIGVHAVDAGLLGAVAIAGGDGRPCVQLLPPAAMPTPAGALRAWRESANQPLRANVVLRTADYRVIPIDPPELPPAEMREAARWQIADALDFPVDDAAIDLLGVPSHQGGMRNQRFVVAAPNECIRRWLKDCQEAQLPLAAVDIPEMAMRNLSVLAAGDSAHAFLYIGLNSTRLTLVWRRELCSFRQLDVSGAQLAACEGFEWTTLLERLALEIQRTADAFSRQFSGIDLETLWLSAAHEPEPLIQALAPLISQRVQRYRVEDHVQVQGGAPTAHAARGHEALLAIGAALRQEAH